eukprot:755065-Hanusia_phi.AAC.5
MLYAPPTTNSASILCGVNHNSRNDMFSINLRIKNLLQLVPPNIREHRAITCPHEHFLPNIRSSFPLPPCMLDDV